MVWVPSADGGSGSGPWPGCGSTLTKGTVPAPKTRVKSGPESWQEVAADWQDRVTIPSPSGPPLDQSRTRHATPPGCPVDPVRWQSGLAVAVPHRP